MSNTLSAEKRLTVRLESYTLIESELVELYPEYQQEVGIEGLSLGKVNPDLTQFRQLDRSGQLYTLGARTEEGQLVGYVIALHLDSILYKGEPGLYSMMIFLKLEYRKGLEGLELIKAFEKLGRSLEVKRIFLGTSLSKDLEHLLTYLKFVPFEVNFLKEL